MKLSTTHKVVLCITAGLLAVPSVLSSQEAFVPWRPTVTINRVSREPTLEDFLDMKPSSDLVDELTKVSGFIQREPNDGEPSKELTDVYWGYDDDNLYVIFVAFDNEPERVRARMGRRESIDRDDDLVWINLDTFNDERRGMVFQCNPYGIQRDSLFVSGVGEDESWDTLWYSRGERTAQGYVVWVALPFRSLRFSNEDQQTWGLLLERWIPRNNDWSFWPQASSRIEGFFNQTAFMKLENISPGRNIQLIPYAASRSFRALDPELPDGPDFIEDFRDISVGLDAKFVIQDSLTLDATANPDFSQVESDEPQVTVNERFEVFFPERRPFFIENAQFFQTPLNLVFTRRIADPLLGTRLTGKVGPWAIGALVADDEAPGKRALPGSPLRGQGSLFGIFRVSRDVFEQGSVGAIYTDWSLDGSSNRVGGADFRFLLTPNLALAGQAVNELDDTTRGARRAQRSGAGLRCSTAAIRKATEDVLWLYGHQRGFPLGARFRRPARHPRAQLFVSLSVPSGENAHFLGTHVFRGGRVGSQRGPLGRDLQPRSRLEFRGTDESRGGIHQEERDVTPQGFPGAYR